MNMIVEIYVKMFASCYDTVFAGSGGCRKVNRTFIMYLTVVVIFSSSYVFYNIINLYKNISQTQKDYFGRIKRPLTVQLGTFKELDPINAVFY